MAFGQTVFNNARLESHCYTMPSTSKKIVICGAGIAGISAAYYLTPKVEEF